MGHRSVTILIACLLSLPLLTGLTAAGGASADSITTWLEGTVHEDISAGEFVMHELDGEGNMHVIFYEETEGAIGYATNEGGEWTHEMIPDTDEAGDRASMALDAEGNVYISFFDQQGRLKYANNRNSWSVSTVTEADVEWSAIAVDSADVARIVYEDDNDDALLYTYRTGSGWAEPVEVDSSIEGFSAIAVAVDGDDVLHVAYKDDFTDELKYATDAGGVWDEEVVDPSIDVNPFIDIALYRDEAVIAFIDGDSDRTTIAQGEAGSWTVEVADNETIARMSVSVAVDSSGNRHLTYYDWMQGDLVYATDVSGEWGHLTLDGSGDKGWSNSITVDASDRVHVLYLDMTDDRLLYMTDEGGRWISETVDSEGDVGSYSAIFVDDDYDVHIVYFDATEHSLKYARESDGWSTEVVDDSAQVGRAPAVAVDSLGDVHIVYFDAAERNLKYTSDIGGEWNPMVMEGITDVGMISSIAIDSDDDVHVVYRDADMGYLVYKNNTDGWNGLRLDETGDVEEGNAMAIGPDDEVHIAYIRNGTLVHVHQDDGEWVFEEIPEADASSALAISVGSDGVTRIAYFDPGLGDLILLSDEEGEWTSSTVDDEGNAGFDAAMVLDAEDLERLVYTDQMGGVRLGYAIKDSGIWMRSSFPDLAIGERVSMAIDGFGRLHISYYDSVTEDLGYLVSLTRPTAPLGFEATGAENTVELDWEPPATDGGSDIVSYRIYRGNSSDSLDLLAEVTDATNHTDSDVEVGETVYYAIEAVSGEGVGLRSGTVSAMAYARPTAPIEVGAHGGDSKVKLTWSAPSSNGGSEVTSYNVYRSSTLSDPVLIGNTTSTSYTDRDLTNGERYYYWVSAVNGVGEGDLASVVDATPSENEGLSDTMLFALTALAVVAVVAVALLVLRQAGKI